MGDRLIKQWNSGIETVKGNVNWNVKWLNEEALAIDLRKSW